jgi:hypothetical protein
MKYFFLPAWVVVMSACACVSAGANAQTPASGVASKDQCAIGYVTGVGGSSQSVHEYLAAADRDKYRYIADNPIQCKVSDDGSRASACTGITTFSHDEVSVYDDVDSATMAVVAKVELEHGTYPAIIVVPRKDLTCRE